MFNMTPFYSLEFRQRIRKHMTLKINNHLIISTSSIFFIFAYVHFWTCVLPVYKILRKLIHTVFQDGGVKTPLPAHVKIPFFGSPSGDPPSIFNTCTSFGGTSLIYSQNHLFKDRKCGRQD